MADPEIVASEPEAFDCDTCEHRRQWDGLDDDNVAAWRFYVSLLAHRWIRDIDAGHWWLARLCRGMDDDEVAELFERVSVIYDVLQPPKP